MSGNEEFIKHSQKNKLYLYLTIGNGWEWEDYKIVTTTEKAIEMSIKLGNSARLQQFEVDEHGLYFPTYKYYENGIYICE